MRWLPVFAFTIPVVAAVACWGPTEVVVVLDTDLPCDTIRARTVGIAVGQSEEALSTPVTTTGSCTTRTTTSDSEIGSLVLVPSGARDSQVLVKAAIGVDHPTEQCLANDGPGCIVARRSTSYLEHRSLRLPIRLESSCLGVVCGPTSTCDHGRCVPLAGCGEQGCVDPSSDGGAPDASSGDGGITCPSGRADCDRDPSNACEVDLLTTVTHCGACNHACGGVQCIGGTCESTRVVKGIDTPVGIVVAAPDVIVSTTSATGGKLFGCPISGCTNAKVLHTAPNGDGLTAPLTSGNKLYWGEQSTGVYRCTLPSCTPIVNVCAEGASTLAVQGTEIILGSSYNLFVGRCVFGSSTATGFANPGNEVVAMTADSTAVFFTTPKTVNSTWGAGIYRCPFPDGCYGQPRPPDFLTPPGGVMADNTPWALDVYGAYVYWTESKTGKVMRMLRTLTGAAKTLATGVRPHAIVVDGSASTLFWIEEGADPKKEGSIHRANLDGTEHFILAKGQSQARGLALGPATDPVPRIFWTSTTTATSGGGEVYFVAR